MAKNVIYIVIYKQMPCNLNIDKYHALTLIVKADHHLPQQQR